MVFIILSNRFDATIIKNSHIGAFSGVHFIFKSNISQTLYTFSNNELVLLLTLYELIDIHGGTSVFTSGHLITIERFILPYEHYNINKFKSAVVPERLNKLYWLDKYMLYAYIVVLSVCFVQFDV